MADYKEILSIKFEEGKKEPLVSFREENFKEFIFINGGSHKEITHIMAHFHRFMWQELKNISENSKK